MVSVIIPAYNEEAVIRRTLSCLLEHANPAELDIIVCCNGCSDRTAEIAREFGPPVRVVETSKGSKTLALNMGDEAALSFPRIYLDADISLTYATVKSIENALNNTSVLAVAPRMRVELTGRHWVIRAFYNIWMKSPYHLRGMIGSGVYALSKEGRGRFERFPDIIADDGFVRAHFAPHERQILEDCSFTVVPPASLSGLLKIKTRAALGNKELSQKHPALVRSLAAAEKKENGRSEYFRLMCNPLLWPQVGVYAVVKTISNFRAKTQLKKLTAYRWERDETSRV